MLLTPTIHLILSIWTILVAIALLEIKDARAALVALEQCPIAVLTITNITFVTFIGTIKVIITPLGLEDALLVVAHRLIYCTVRVARRYIIQHKQKQKRHRQYTK